MKKLFSILCFGLMIIVSTGVNGQDYAPVVNFGDGIINIELDTGITCSPGGLVRDDGAYENGYQQFVDSTSYVHKLIPPTTPFIINAICVAWTRVSSGMANITYDLVIYDTTGTGGQPGNLIGIVTGVTATGIAVFPLHSRFRYQGFNITVNSGFYIGVRFDNNPINSTYISVDESGALGAPGYWRNTNTFPAVWNLLPAAPFGNWRHFGIRAEGIAPAVLPAYCGCDPGTPYVAVTGTAGPSGDDVTITVPIPFTFTHVGVPYTSASICTNGFIVMGTSTFNAFSVNLCLTTPPSRFPMIAPLWTDLNTETAGNIVYTTLGTGPNRIFVVQWANVGFFDGGAGRVTMQARLYENGNRIEFHYGPGVTDPTPEAGAVGLSKAPGGSGNIISLTPNATCTPGVSTTACNNNVAYNTANFPSNRRYFFECPVAIEPVTSGIPREYKLSQNYPNPFNPATKISYALPKAGNVKLTVSDILGREVGILVNEYKKAGTYDIQFNGSNLSSGVYFYKIETKEFTDTKRMLLIK